ncbi:synaptotagmin-like protein 2 isoform X1 [Rhinichthys klamathensis goyatoka]|uniref:synaptotagmin-like protein 2 isoform X1 n=2 Tax=Rhinichthys klamathensis goyatoka TaxID=3034132 RepID=UPI0024B4DE88|nr:synaptotagmin-like protein 2 isoform X1 [Rhinichthys klamathensis goyatoka]
MIDLTYLTEEEQEMILTVLKRDAELKKLEEQRIKQLRKTERDRGRLKYLTGEWFYETKYHRHREKIHGSDIIRASMRQRKPVTILELSQRWSEKSSRVYGEKKDVYIPPELSGLIEDPSTQSQNERVDDEAQQERPQIKPRQNPFNSVRLQRDEARLNNGVKEANQTPAEEPFFPAESYTHHTTLNTDNTDTHVATQCKPVPKKRLLLYSCKDSSLDTGSSDNGVRQVMTPAPRGILKQKGSSCSSTDSLRLHIPTNNGSSSSQSSATVSPISPEPPISPHLSPCSVHSASGWLDRKQVRFTSVVGPIERVQGEHSVLEEDWSPVLDQNRSHITENGHHELYGEPQSSQVSNIHSSTEVTGKAIELSAEGQTDKVTVEEGRSISKILEWFGRGSRDGKLKESPVKRELNEEEPKESPEAKSEDSASPVDQPKTKPAPKPRRGLFALFSRAEKKDKIPEVQASDKEVISRAKTESLEREPSCTLRPETEDNILQSRMAEILKDKNKPDRLICEDTPPRETFDQGEVSPGKMANLKSFWERGDRGPKILSIKKEPEVEESETSQLSDNYHNALDRRLSDSNTSPSKPKPSDPNPVDVESTTGEISSVSPRRSSCGIDTSAISSCEDGNPSSLDSNKVSEGSSSELQTLTVKVNVKLSPSSLLKYKDSLASDLQEESICRDISDLKKEISTFKMSLSQQEDKVSINDLKSFWEKEKSGLKVIVGSPTCTANVKDPYTESSPKCSSVGLSEPQFNIRSNSPSSLDRKSFNEVGLIAQKEKMEKTEEKQRSPIRMPLQDLQDIRGRVSYVTTNISNFKQSVSDKHSKPSPPSSPLRSLPPKGQNDKPQSADIYQPKDQDQTRTTSPLRQSKVPRRDSYPNKESKKDGSPLRTFAIDINPGDRSPCDVRVKSGQTRLYTSPEHQGKTPEGRSDDRPIILKERKLSADSLTRFYIPLSLHHYLGLPEQTVLDEREQVKVQACGTFEQVNQGIVSNESSPSRHSLPESEEITFDSSGSSTPEAWSISHTSSYWDSEDDGPVKAALERANARPISISKSLEDLASTQERWKTDPRSDVGMSMENVSAVTPNTKTSFSDPEQVKMMSMSVPAFMQQEMDCGNSDCASVSSFHYDRLRTCNTPSNFSTCSEAASMSSVTGSVMSIYSSDFGNVEVKGIIQFAIHYVQKLGEFHIFVVQCKDLAVADVKRNRSDPYVKCYLLPDKAKYGKKKTCVRKKTLDPAYNEILRFKISMETLKTQKLNISVWHNDTFGRNSFLGEVEVDLAEWDFNNTQMNEYLLKGRVQVPTSPKHSVGGEEMSAEIKVALRFLPQTSHSHKNKGNGEVQIWVKECKNLPISRGVAIDPFVKCAVLPDASRKNRQKTRVLKRSSNPVFNHTMVYDGFIQEDLKEACVELTVWDHDRLNNHFIGGIRLGNGTGKSYGTEVNWMDSNAAEAALWERMMQSQNEWVEDTLPLRMMVMARMSR